ncbi:hypothetical protein [Streptomyces sp. NPDC021622]|uniref:hypothetical protein n=1 Tax=Streptomyces sp. NPDC021622 TaxID=3155013 RepID=UPI00340317B2
MSALIGGGIAVASGWTVERGRWRREEHRHERDRRTALYADYLAAVLSAREQIWHASRWRELPRDERIAMARDALRDSQVYPIQHRVSLVGPPEIEELSNQVASRLTAYRDAVIEAANESEEANESDVAIRPVWDALTEARQALRTRMRADLDALR